MRRVRVRRRIWLALFVSVGLSQAAEAQIRGVYPTGMNARNAGVTPESGFTYSNLFIFNARDESKGSTGEVVATGSNAVMIDLNTFVWVSRRTVLGGAKFSATASPLVSNNSLASDTAGQLSAGGGFGDFFVQPFILGWQTDRIAFRMAYGELAPTGRFNAGADNVGSGYWTHAPSVGATIYLSRDQATTLSAFHMYEFHTGQEGTDIHPGQNADLDYSIAHMIRVNEETRLQLAVVGLWSMANHRQDRADDHRDAGPRTLRSQCARLRDERLAAGAQSKPRAEVLQRVLESVDLSGLHAADFGSSDLLGHGAIRRQS